MAAEGGMSLPTVKRYETAASAKVSDREIDKLRAALEASGIEFIDGTGREAQESEGQAEMTPAQCRADRAALLDDCTRSVTMAPQNAPRSGVAAALPSTVRSAEPASVFKPPVMTVIPSKKKPTPPRIEIVIDIRALLG